MRLISKFIVTAAIGSALVVSMPTSSFAALSPACLDLFNRDVIAAPQDGGKTIEERLRAAIKTAIPVGQGRKIYIEAVPPARPDLPTFVLMPGMNRASMLTDASSQNLFAMGFGVAAFNFSIQPHSVNALEPGARPYFRTKAPKLEDLAYETDVVAETLRKSFGISNVVPVSLSFSGAVTPHLKGYPLIIETVPMTDEHATNPDGASARSTLKMSQMFNPIFGPSIVRSTMDNALRKKWTPQVESMINNFKLSAERKSDYVEGYTSLSRAAEDASWKNAKLDPKTRRVFIVAQNEGPLLLLNQLQTFKELLSKQPQSILFLVGRSGHIVPADQPAIFASILSAVTTSEHAMQSGVAVIIPPGTSPEDKGQFFELSGPKAVEWLEKEIVRLTEKVQKK